jgi:hypothetical protein
MVQTQGSAEGRVTEWVGMVLFAGILLATVGFFNLIEGLIALFRDDFYLVRPDGLVLSFDYTVWGVLLLLSAVLLMATGWGVVAGKTWARVAAIIVVFVDALFNMLFLPAYPVWATLIIALNVFLIFVLVVHGRETKYIPR